MTETKPTLKAFKALIAAHDLTYSYSDDQLAWRAGAAQKRAIDSMAAKLPRKSVVREWNRMVKRRMGAHAAQYLWTE